MFDNIDRSKEDMLWNYGKLSDSEKLEWHQEALLILRKNNDAGLIGYAVDLLCESTEGKYALFKLLRDSPDKSKNYWNEIILTALVENKFQPLGSEFPLVDKVLNDFRTELFRLDFLLHYAHLNQQYSLDRICDLVVNHGFGTPKVLENYGNKIYSMLYAVDKSLPDQLIACAKRGGVDISNLRMYYRT